MAKSFDFETEYELRGDIVRYIGEAVFKQFQSVSSTKALYILTDDELKEVRETLNQVIGSVEGYLTPIVNANQVITVSKPDPRPVVETQNLDIGYKATEETVAEAKPVAGSPASVLAPDQLAASKTDSHSAEVSKAAK